MEHEAKAGWIYLEPLGRRTTSITILKTNSRFDLEIKSWERNCEILKKILSDFPLEQLKVLLEDAFDSILRLEPIEVARKSKPPPNSPIVDLTKEDNTHTSRNISQSKSSPVKEETALPSKKPRPSKKTAPRIELGSASARPALGPATNSVSNSHLGRILKRGYEKMSASQEQPQVKQQRTSTRGWPSKRGSKKT